MDLGLKDKIAVVTGASSGIGLAVADCFASEGVHLVICARNKERLHETGELPGVDILVNNAGRESIVNNASILSRQPLEHEPIYNVVKAALVMFSKCLSSELIKYNIRVNCVSPGLILTPRWQETAELLCNEKGITHQEYLDQIAKQYTPIGRFAAPEEIAPLFVFLCSPRANYCVGSSYYVDGGWLKVTT